MTARRVLCVIAVLACFLLGTVTAYADGHGSGHSFGISYALSCYPYGLPGTGNTSGASAYDGIIWLNPDITPTLVSVNDSVADDVYRVSYSVQISSSDMASSLDNATPLYGVVLTFPVGYTVTLSDGIYHYSETFDKAIASGRVIKVNPLGLTAYRADGSSYVVESSEPVYVFAELNYASGSLDQAAGQCSSRVSVEKYVYTPYPVDNPGDVRDRLAYPFNLDGVDEVLDSYATISSNALFAPVIYGAVFLMLAAMVIKMMM